MTNTKIAPRIVDKLRNRGYDLTTLKFSVKKLDAPVEGAKEG